MPELPEVETVRSGLAQYLIGATVAGIRVYDTRSLKRNLGGVLGFEQEVLGARIKAVVRRGKFLWMPINEQRAIVGHLGMSGQILVRSPEYEADKLARVVLAMESGGSSIEMRFVDQRLFGGLQVDDLVATADGYSGGFSPEAEIGAEIPQSVSHIARDLLDPFFDAAAVAKRMAAKNSGIKRVLLDQGLMSGIGNIYADETLWLAKLHFDKLSSEIPIKKHLELLNIAKEVLRKAVAQGGTSFDEQYKNVNGESGYFSQSLNAYGQTGLPCGRCGTLIRREAWANRGSHFCPKCQKR
jgi:formamidopyrimidine-DNA glycosylase